MKNVFKLTLKDKKSGKVTDERIVKNYITYLGIGHMLDVCKGRSNVDSVTTGGSCWIALGTGSIAQNYWLSGLVSEVSGTGNLGRSKLDASSRLNYSAYFSTTFDVDIASGALTECGLFVKGYGSGNSLLEPGSALNTGVCYDYISFAALNKDATNTLQVDIEVENGV